MTPELETLMELLSSTRPRAEAVVIGLTRPSLAVPVPGAQVEAFVRAWGGTVLAVVDWPEEAASWLRQARRFAAGPPDAWVVAGAPLGWARMSARLRQSTDWTPERTFGFASTAHAVALAEPGTLEGMRGASEDGGVWRLGRNLIHRER